MDISRYVTTAGAAEIIGCTDGYVRQLLRAGVLTGEKVSERSWLIPKREAEKVKKAESSVGRPRSRKKVS